jgi:protein-S-isoprenylcysteine O-methyltransferase Ste14
VTRKKGHRIVDSGPYRFVRHPIYTGFIVIYVGLAFLCASALALFGVTVITIGLWIKARVEEQFLSEELGATVYGAYKARTPMLVPGMPRRPEVAA